MLWGEMGRFEAHKKSVSILIAIWAAIFPIFSICSASAQEIAQELEGLNPLWTHEEELIEDGPSQTADEKPPESLTELLAQPLWGIFWKGRTQEQENIDTAMLPASVQKMLTAATATETLGLEFRFTNRFDAIQIEKHLDSLEMTLSGDPTLGHRAFESLSGRFDRIAVSLKRQGIKTASPDLKLSFSRSELATLKRPGGWRSTWGMACYASLPTSVMLNGNCATLKINSIGAVWETPGVSTPVRWNEEKGMASRGVLRVTPAFDDQGRVSEYQITGRARSAQRFNLPVHHNENWLKALFYGALKKQGIRIQDQPDQSPGIESLPVMIDFSSVTLREMLIPFLQQSINLIGDRLYWESAFVTASSNAAQASEQTLRLLTRESTLPEEVLIDDGSGLSLRNRTTSRVLYEMLVGLSSRPYFESFLNSLSVSGLSGTLRRRLSTTETRGRVFGKTGTLDGVSNLAGYFKAPSGDLLPFVVLTQTRFSAATARAKIDQRVIQFVHNENH